ncbi:putative lavin-dependent oxidoreductase [Klebsiella quasipneumoniae]|nr:putative lavin-dependent oxidoreductase [Klebsiella quasipneumoniae]
MSIQFLGMIGHRLSSETIAPVGPIFDRDYIVRFAQPMKPPGSIACWWVTGPINPTAFW